MVAVYKNDFAVNDSYEARVYSMHRSNLSRRKQKRNSFKAFAIPFVLVLIVLFCAAIVLMRPAKKANAKNGLYETRLVSVKVESGDSLWSIAEQYYCSEKESIRDCVARIKQTNRLEGDTIYPDTYLLIQYSVRK